jgi:hypothetical protein
VGTGFWVIQAIFLMAAVATAIYAERQRRRDEREADDRHVPVQGSTDFTIHEEALLLVLRERIREARQGRGGLRDDLAADSSEPYSFPPGRAPDALAAPTVMRPARSAPRSTLRRRARRGRPARSTAGGWMLVAGVMCFAGGVGGMWHTNVVLDSIELAQTPLTSAPRMTFAARTLPGPIANPAKYFEAVNSASASASTPEVEAILEQKQAMDRWEALMLFGLAVLVASFVHPGVLTSVGRPRGSFAGDVVGFIGLAAVMCASLSFFELA